MWTQPGSVQGVSPERYISPDSVDNEETNHIIYEQTDEERQMKGWWSDGGGLREGC